MRRSKAWLACWVCWMWRHRFQSMSSLAARLGSQPALASPGWLWWLWWLGDQGFERNSKSSWAFQPRTWWLWIRQWPPWVMWLFEAARRCAFWKPRLIRSDVWFLRCWDTADDFLFLNLWFLGCSIECSTLVSFSGAAVDFGHGSTCGLCLIVDCLGKERGWFLVAHTIPSIPSWWIHFNFTEMWTAN